MSSSRLEKDVTKPLLWMLFVAMVGAVAVLAVIPLVTTMDEGPPRAEAEQLMGAARDACRVAYSHNHDFADAEHALAEQAADFEGKYYRVTHELEPAGDGRARVRAVPRFRDGRTAYMEFNWSDGNSRIVWE